MLVAGVVRVWIVMSFERSGSVHFLKKLSFQYLERRPICKAQKSTILDTNFWMLDVHETFIIPPIRFLALRALQLPFRSRSSSRSII